VITLTYPDGSLGTLTYLANGDKSFPKERVEVFSGGRVAVLDDFRALETVKDGRRKTVRSRLAQDKGHAASLAGISAGRAGGRTRAHPLRAAAGRHAGHLCSRGSAGQRGDGGLKVLPGTFQRRK
jgi:hypothetical protein